MIRPGTIGAERGAIAGLEGLMFGVLILLGGLTIIVNAWSVVDSKIAIDAASREYLRVYTNRSDPISARLDAESAARTSLKERNFTSGELKIELLEVNGFGPCSTATVTISAQVPAIRAPFIDDFTPVRVSSTLTELTSAHMEMTTDSNYSAELTECFGG